jgi:hypothetical protein
MRQPTSPVIRWSTYIIELGWLAAIFCIPSFFNLLSSRHFEPDKALVFRFIVIILSTFVVLNYTETRRTSRVLSRMGHCLQEGCHLQDWEANRLAFC